MKYRMLVQIVISSHLFFFFPPLSAPVTPRQWGMVWWPGLSHLQQAYYETDSISCDTARRLSLRIVRFRNGRAKLLYWGVFGSDMLHVGFFPSTSVTYLEQLVTYLLRFWHKKVVPMAYASLANVGFGSPCKLLATSLPTPMLLGRKGKYQVKYTC